LNKKRKLGVRVCGKKLEKDTVKVVEAVLKGEMEVIGEVARSLGEEEEVVEEIAEVERISPTRKNGDLITSTNHE
jgi:hypothetical protein